MRASPIVVFAFLVSPALAAPVDILTSGIDGIRYWTGDGRGGFAAARHPVSELRHHASVAVGDLNADGTDDLFAVRFATDAQHTVLFGNGKRRFTVSGQRFGGKSPSWGVKLADLDADGDLDAYVSTTIGTKCPADEVWLNDGMGIFIAGDGVGAECSSASVLIDVDADKDVDIIAANSAMNGERPDAPGFAKVWLNDGSAHFSSEGADFGPLVAHDVAAGDFDGDGDPDVVIAATPVMRILINEGAGRFSLSPQEMGAGSWFGVAIADLDGDRDQDIVGATADRKGGRVWFNNGDATFRKGEQRLSRRNSLGVAVADVDNDGDIDVLFANRTPEEEAAQADAAGGGNEIWMNDGNGTLTRAARGLGTGLTRKLTVVGKVGRP